MIKAKIIFVFVLVLGLVCALQGAACVRERSEKGAVARERVFRGVGPWGSSFRESGGSHALLLFAHVRKYQEDGLGRIPARGLDDRMAGSLQ